jgi:hypothetical protein
MRNGGESNQTSLGQFVTSGERKEPKHQSFVITKGYDAGMSSFNCGQPYPELHASLCNLCVLCVLVVDFPNKQLTTETQRTQALHREIQTSCDPQSNQAYCHPTTIVFRLPPIRVVTPLAQATFNDCR